MPQSPKSASNPAPSPLSSNRPDLTRHKVLSSISRAAVLELLRSRAEPLGVVEVAEHVGLHQNTVRSHLDLLVESGFAIRRSEPPSRPGRPRVVYEATAAPGGESDYRLLAEILAHHLAADERPGLAAVNAGQSWAMSHWRKESGEGDGSTARPRLSEDDAIAAVVKMLGDTGFAPQVSPDGTSIYLHRCPFRDLAATQQDVVCGAHLGIIQGALAELGGLVSATRLLPFVTPGLCVATLTRHTAARANEKGES
jgi:predicted ArsR family transcriptional regulator